MNHKAFRRKLRAWFAARARDLPWRRTRDPYRIWLSEVMLQQTRVAAVIPYYERFLAKYPTVKHLAEAPEQELLAVWSGLGYYSRARNLHKAAREILNTFQKFPNVFVNIRKLPGVGDYTAAAIASIAFDLPHAAVDGNVLRVLSRVENDAADILRNRAHFQELADRYLDRDHPGDFNQAVMELGATVCLPKSPRCPECPVRDLCGARAAGTVGELPMKLRTAAAVHEQKCLLVIRRKEKVLFLQRSATNRRLAGFWELPETAAGAKPGKTLGEFRHAIVNHRYVFQVVEARVSKTPWGFVWAGPAEWARLPLSTTARKALQVAGLLEIN